MTRVIQSLAQLMTFSLSFSLILRQLNLIQADLGDIYSKAKICSYKSKGECNLELEPDLTLLLKESRDYDELKYYWTEWRNASGKKMRSKYLRYVDLSNENANKNGL